MSVRSQGRAVPGKRFDPEVFGALLVARGLSLSELSRRTAGPGVRPVSQSLLSAYLAGKYTPRLPTLGRIARVLEVEPGALLKPA